MRIKGLDGGFGAMSGQKYEGVWPLIRWRAQAEAANLKPATSSCRGKTQKSKQRVNYFAMACRDQSGG